MRKNKFWYLNFIFLLTFLRKSFIIKMPSKRGTFVNKGGMTWTAYNNKQLVTKDKNGDKFVLANREKNRNFMLEYGLLTSNIKNIILNLEVNDYYKGPEQDDAGFEGEIWIFTPTFQNMKLYIKIRLANNTLVICISIHEYGIY